jgi:hypothetical protein
MTFIKTIAILPEIYDEPFGDSFSHTYLLSFKALREMK